MNQQLSPFARPEGEMPKVIPLENAVERQAQVVQLAGNAAISVTPNPDGGQTVVRVVNDPYTRQV